LPFRCELFRKIFGEGISLLERQRYPHAITEHNNDDLFRPTALKATLQIHKSKLGDGGKVSPFFTEFKQIDLLRRACGILFERIFHQFRLHKLKFMSQASSSLGVTRKSAKKKSERLLLPENHNQPCQHPQQAEVLLDLRLVAFSLLVALCHARLAFVFLPSSGKLTLLFLCFFSCFSDFVVVRFGLDARLM
jgi:hypothetical protein